MCVQTYGALVVKVKNLEKEVLKMQLHNKWLKKETEVQAKIISQLKNMSRQDQTEPLCIHSYFL